jgi:tRNA1(Val) A37 N6-methylase TrmN6
MVSFVRSKTEVIVSELEKVISDSGQWPLEEKRGRLYPLTSELLKCGIKKRRAIAETLAQVNGNGRCGYKAVTVEMETSRLRPTIFLPIDTFNPNDPWGKLFRRSLDKLDVGGRTVCEVGPGSGAVVLELINRPDPPAKIILVELDPHVLSVAQLNIETVCYERIMERNIKVEYRAGDATSVFAQMAKKKDPPFDYIVGCIPQVPAGNGNLQAWQNTAHEYDDRAHKHFREWGLGLLHDVQSAGKRMLSSSGAMVFVHSGRVPEAVRTTFHNALQLRVSNKLINEMIPHCPTTPLAYLFGHTEHLLFADRNGKNVLPPEQAETTRQQAVGKDPYCNDCGVYHRVLVLETKSL